MSEFVSSIPTPYVTPRCFEMTPEADFKEFEAADKNSANVTAIRKEEDSYNVENIKDETQVIQTKVEALQKHLEITQKDLATVRSENKNFEAQLNQLLVEYQTLLENRRHIQIQLDKFSKINFTELFKSIDNATSKLEKHAVRFLNTAAAAKVESLGGDADEFKQLSDAKKNTYQYITRIQDLVGEMHPVGHGGEGRVYRGTLQTSNTPVVIKSYFLDCESSSRIEYAMLVLSSKILGVKTPVGLYRTATNSYLIVEDDHNSVPLHIIVERAVLNESEIQQIFSQIAHIMIKLSEMFIKHRDIKLDNFLFNTVTGRLTIIDFGWAMYTAVDSVSLKEIKRSGETLMGTFDYLPPEIDGPADSIVSYEKATVFSLGCLLLELFFGFQGRVRHLIGDEKISIFFANLMFTKKFAPSKVALSVIEKCLRKDPAMRFNLDQLIQHPWILSKKALERPIFGEAVRKQRIKAPATDKK